MWHKRFFSFKTRWHQKIYEILCSLPESLKNIIIGIYCKNGRRWVEHLEVPARLIWFITSKCPGSCNGCLLKDYRNNQEDMPIEDIDRIVRSVKSKVSIITLTGGEPFMRNDFPDICRVLDRHNRKLIVSIPTAGFMPEKIEGMLRKVLRTTKLFLRVHVSLDGLENLHDEIRGYSGLFKNAVNTINRCKKLQREFSGFQQLTVLTTISPNNASAIIELIEFVKRDLGVFHKFQFSRNFDKDVFDCDKKYISKLSSNVRLDTEHMAGLIDILTMETGKSAMLLELKKEKLMHQVIKETIIEKKKIVSCLAGRFEGVILLDGSVSICECIRPFANLYDYDLNLLQLWKSSDREELIGQVKNCFCTHPCHLSTALMFDEGAIKRLVNE